MAYGIIYLLIDATNDKEYVGQTIRTLAKRFYQHKHGDQYVDRVIQKRGEDLIATAILKECDSKEELDYWEKHFIHSRDTMAPNGYNLTEGGIGTTGKNNPFFGKRNLTYRALEEIIGYNKTNVTTKMSGKKNFTVEQVAKLVEIFGKPAQYLLARNDTEDAAQIHCAGCSGVA